MRTLVAASLALALASPPGAYAADGDEIKSLKSEVEALKKDYEARLQALERKLRAAEAAAQEPPPPASAPGPVAAPPAAGGANAFNPSVSLILSGTYASTSQDPAAYAISGFPLPSDAEIGPGNRGFSLAESELALAANIDPWLYGAANISLAPDDSVSVEEAYIQTTSLSNGFTLRAGRFFSGIGYLNEQHSHTWDFVDNPLAYQAMLGTQYGDDGVRLQWLAPTELYLALGAELGRGRTFPGSDANNNGAGMSALYAHVGGDLGDSNSWRAGLSLLNAKAEDQSLLFGADTDTPAEGSFTGNTHVWVGDFVWKWAPNGNATRTSFKLQGEYLHSRRDGTLLYDPAGAAAAGSYVVDQAGWYLQGVYQFMPRWRLGLRTDRLDAGTPEFAASGVVLGGTGFRPSRNTLMVDFSASEFSRVRLQYARDRAREGVTDNQVFVQYQMSLGAHGAHSY